MDYTKGEWNIWIHPDRIPPEGEGFWAIYVADEQGKAIAKISRDNTDEMKANARLITAAPAIYEALKNLVGRYEQGLALGDKLDLEPARIALLKAEREVKP